MSRPRSSSLPQEYSVSDSSLRVRYHFGHDPRQIIYPGLRAPVSDDTCSNERRSLRNSFLVLPEEARDVEAFEAARHSSERQSVMPLTSREAGEFEFGYSCVPERSNTSMVASSESELDPQDSISNRGPSPSDNGRNLLFQQRPGWCNVHGCYMSAEFFDPKYRAWIQTIHPRVRMMCLTYYRRSSYADRSIY